MTIYTNSYRAHGVGHDFGALWHERGFITSTGTPVKNDQLIANFLQAILLPSQIAFIKCDVHTDGSHDSWVNARTDEAAKVIAISQNSLLVF